MLISVVRLHILPKESMVLLTFGDSLEQPAEEFFWLCFSAPEVAAAAAARSVHLCMF